MTQASYSDTGELEATGPRHFAFWSKYLPTDQGYVYFIQENLLGRVKVGFTANYPVRMKALQTGSADKLNLLVIIPAGRDVEAQFHKQVSADRIRGEWFSGDKLNMLLAKAYNMANLMVADHDGTDTPPDVYRFDVSLVRPKATSSFVDRVQAGLEERRRKREEFAAANEDYDAPWAGRVPDWALTDPMDTKVLGPRRVHGDRLTPFK